MVPDRVYFGACVSVSFEDSLFNNDVLKSSQARGGFSSEEEKEIFWLFKGVENMVSETNSNNYVNCYRANLHFKK